MLSIAASPTGEFEDTEQDGLIPAHDLRLRLLYTDYVNGKWRDPKQDLSDSEMRAEVTLSAEHLEDALEEIIGVLES